MIEEAFREKVDLLQVDDDDHDDDDDNDNDDENTALEYVACVYTYCAWTIHRLIAVHDRICWSSELFFLFLAFLKQLCLAYVGCR